jgi:site-specific recombinase XerC
VRRWFEERLAAAVPDYDGTLDTARRAAEAFARRSKADNTHRAYRAGVRAWTAWCRVHHGSCLPAAPDDVAAFLAEQRQLGLKANTIDLRRAAIRYLHWLAGVDLPTGQAAVSETIAGIHRAASAAGERPVKKLAATVSIVADIVAAIPADLTGLRDRALILVGFVGALRRSEIAALRLEHLTECERGLELYLPVSKGDREGKGETVPLPYGQTALCPVSALHAWFDAVGITEGAAFRRIWRSPPPKDKPEAEARFLVGADAIDDGTVARIIKRRAAAVGLNPELFGGHSLKRGAMTTGMDANVHPARLKRLGRHRTYAVMGEYLEMGNLFENHPLLGLI